MWTGSSPAVRSPTAAAAAAGSMLSVAGSMSQKTGVTPSYSRQLAEATKLNGLVMTSSPGPQSSARTPRWRAAVPEDTPTASSTPSHSAKAPSKRSSAGPSESLPERMVCCSRGPLALADLRLERILKRVDERLPGRFDDVLGDANRPPRIVSVG